MTTRKRTSDEDHDAAVRSKYPRLELSVCKGSKPESEGKGEELFEAVPIQQYLQPPPEVEKKLKPRTIPDLVKEFFRCDGVTGGQCSEFLLGYLVTQKAVQRNLAFKDALEQLQRDPICSEGVASVAVFENGFWRLRPDLSRQETIHIDMDEESDSPPLLEEDESKKKARELDTALFKIEVLEQQKKDMDKRVTAMEEDLCHARNQADSYRSQVQAARLDTSDVQKELDIANAEKDKFHVMWQKEAEENAARAGSFYGALSECTECPKLKTEVQQLKADAVGARNERDVVLAVSRTIQGQRDQLKADLAASIEARDTLRDNSARNFKEAAELKAQLEDEKKQHQQTADRAQAYANQLKNHSTTIMQQDATLKRVTEELDNNTQLLTDLRSDVARARAIRSKNIENEEKLAELRAQVQKLEEENKALSKSSGAEDYDQQAEVREEVDRLRKELKAAEQDGENLKSEYQRLKKEFHEYEQETSAKLTSVENQREDYKMKFEEAELQFQAVSTHADELRDRLEPVLAIVDELGIDLRPAADPNDVPGPGAIILFRGYNEDNEPEIWIGKVKRSFKKSVEVQWFTQDNDTCYRLTTLGHDGQKSVTIDAVHIIGQIEALPYNVKARRAFKDYVCDNSFAFADERQKRDSSVRE